VIDKDRRAERYSALLRRHNPLGTDIPDEDVAAIFMLFDIYVARVKRLARQSDVAYIALRNAGGNPDGRATLTAFSSTTLVLVFLYSIIGRWFVTVTASVTCAFGRTVIP
jgi:hypothetical protein